MLKTSFVRRKDFRLGNMLMKWQAEMNYWSGTLNSNLVTELCISPREEGFVGIFYNDGNELMVLRAKTKKTIVSKCLEELNQLRYSLDF